MGKKIIIVGGVAGGASTAARLRRLDEEAEIVLFERDEYISFANCGLPYYIGGAIKERDKLLVQTVKGMTERFNIDIRVNSEVISLDNDKKTVKVRTKDGNEYEESFDYLVLSPGAKPIKPPIEGIDNKRIFTLRNIPDTDKIKEYVDKNNVEKAVVIGGGYIGVEMAENLKERGTDVTLVEAAPHILAPFDSDMVVIAEKELQDNGVEVIIGDGVKSFKEGADNKVNVILNSGKQISCDMVVLSIGVAPDTKFLSGSGIELGPKGHILVNQNMKTNVENVYAVGDAVEVVDFVNKGKTAIALAGPANKMGRIAADNISGIDSKYKGTQGTSVIKIFGLTGACTGNNERTCKGKNIAYKVIYIHPVSHASYYPNATGIDLKLIFGLDGKILGAQAFGYEGVDKRIDDIAITMRLNGTVEDLTELELSYAPPFSSAKDPVNMAGFVAQNVLSGKSDIIVSEDILNRNEKETMLIDVRTALEYSNGYIEGAKNIPVDELRGRLSEIDKNKEIYIYCQVGLRGYVAERILKENGFRVKNLTGGYKTYKMMQFKPSSNLPKDKPSDTCSACAEPKRIMLDACGLCCPGPLMSVKSSIDGMAEGEVLEVSASDAGFFEDIKAWCKRTNNELLEVSKNGGTIKAVIKKGNSASIVQDNTMLQNKDNKTIVVFSGDLDKALASFIIANGAASMGKKVTMFFTFWGLNILRKPEKVDVKKGFIDKMFGAMMPRGSKKLKLSKMNMMGMGTSMMRKVMQDKNISSLEDLIQSAKRSGIQIVACQMSMDVMGITEAELIDGVKIGGVGYYLGEAEDSNVNLFI